MRSHQESYRASATWLVVLLFALPAVMSLVVLGARLSSVVDEPGSLLSTTGGESISIYNVMKAARGLPLYEDPREPPYYPTTLYNAGFYRAYELVARGFGSNPAHLVVAIRLLTFALACGGVAGLLFYTLRDLRARPGRSMDWASAIALASIAITTVFGTVTGWWVLSVRPDVGAAAFCMAALAIVLKFGTGRDVLSGCLAGLCLAAAWSFKQSCGLTLVGLVVAGLIQKRYRFVAALSIPVLAVVIGMMAALGPEYRYNAFFATSLSGFSLHNLADLSGKIAVKGAFPLAAAIVALAMLPGMSWLRRDERITLVSCWCTTLLGAVVSSCRNGSEMNYFFEFWAVVAFLGSLSAKHLLELVGTEGKRRAPVFVMALLALISVGTAGLDIARFVFPGKLGATRLVVSAEKSRELNLARALIARTDGPVFCQPALTGLAWNLPFPVYIFDDAPYFHKPAVQRGLLHGGGFSELIETRHFAILVFENDNQSSIETAIKAGYERLGDTKEIVLLKKPGASLNVAAHKDYPGGRPGR